MTKQELEDKYFHEFLVWCGTFDSSLASSHLVFWLDHNLPTLDNFWEWLAKYKVEQLSEQTD